MTDSPNKPPAASPGLTNVKPTPFIFVICQNGAEQAVKREVLTNYPNLRLSFSRPGFITFKVDPDAPLRLHFHLQSTLSRTYGWSLEKLQSEDANQLIDSVVAHPLFAGADRVHLWERDNWLPGRHGFEPGVSELSKTLGEKIDAISPRSDKINQYANANDLVFDIVLVDPNQWWLGFHYATTVAGRWPGGAPTFDVSKEVFSRAYFKLKEALLWSGIKIQANDVCAEIGSAPGGASQLLLEFGSQVIGVDPAEMETEILDHPRFTHIRRRSYEVKRRDFREVDWLLADLNAAPSGTIDSVSEIAAHDSVNLKGMILTVKLSEWSLVDSIASMMKRIETLGFQVVKSRQLAFNRREFCLVAVKNKFTLRKTRRASPAN